MVTSAGKEAVVNHLRGVDIRRLRKFVHLRAELAAVVFPDLAVFIGKPVLLLRQPVGGKRSRLRHQVYFESRLFEDIKGMKSFGDEDA